MAVQTAIQPNGPGTSFAGPLISGSRPSASSINTTLTVDNQGIALLTQVALLTQNGTAAVSFTANIPKHSQIVDFLVDNTTIWNSATSAALTIGTAAADTTYLSSLTLVTTATSARQHPTVFTTTQLTAMGDTGTTETVVFTITPTGATSAGTTFVTMQYIQTQNYQNN
jgi:hypothetical protein